MMFFKVGTFVPIFLIVDKRATWVKIVETSHSFKENANASVPRLSYEVAIVIDCE